MARRLDTWELLLLELYRRHLEDPATDVTNIDLQAVTKLDDREAVYGLDTLLNDELVHVPSAPADTPPTQLAFTCEPLRLTKVGLAEASILWGSV